MTNKQKLVIFDFDYTLYNAERWKDLAYLELASLIGEESTSFTEIAKQVYAETREVGYFDPELFSEALAKRFASRVTKDEILRTIQDSSLFQKSYYPETKDVLELLQDSVRFGMFSTNDDAFQRLKSAVVIDYFVPELIFVSKNKQEIMHKIGELTEQYQVYLVDDLIEILEKVKGEHPDIVTIWIKRGPYATKVQFTEFKPDKIIYNLKELPEIVNN